MIRQTVFVAALLCALPAYAADVEDRFKSMDSDGDGAISQKEFETSMPQMQGKAFSRIDTDNSGTLSRSEWEAFKKDHGMGGKGMGGMPSAPAKDGKPSILPPKAN